MTSFILKLKCSMKPSQRKLYSLPAKSTQVRVVLPPPLPVVSEPKSTPLYTFSDGSILKQMDAKQLASTEIWHSQRTLDIAHKQKIQKQVVNTIQALDGSLYHIVRYPPDEEGEPDVCRIIDGQHRVSILKEYFENADSKSFPVLVKEKACKTEEEAIAYFKVLNTTKAIEWKEDPKLVAQKYMLALLGAFENHKNKYFRVQKTKRPFVQFEKLFGVLVNRRIGIGMELKPDEFAQRAVDWNERKIDLVLNQEKRTSVEDHALSLGFMLGLDESFSWLDAILS